MNFIKIFFCFLLLLHPHYTLKSVTNKNAHLKLINFQKGNIIYSTEYQKKTKKNNIARGLQDKKRFGNRWSNTWLVSSFVSLNDEAVKGWEDQSGNRPNIVLEVGHSQVLHKGCVCVWQGQCTSETWPNRKWTVTKPFPVSTNDITLPKQWNADEK